MHVSASVQYALRPVNDEVSVMKAQLVAFFVAAGVACGDKREKVSASCY